MFQPSSRRKDRLRKMEIYHKAGIPHFWLVDPEGNTLEAFMLREENYVLIAAVGPGDEFAHPAFSGLEWTWGKYFTDRNEILTLTERRYNY